MHLHEQDSAPPSRSADPVPSVILESGIAASSLSWALVQPEIAKFARVCSYDRAGLGWSRSPTKPRALEQMVSELAALLKAASIPPPYVLVGHSFGGLLIRAFAYWHPTDVAGLVFVDPIALYSWVDTSLAQRRRLAKGVSLSRRGAFLARFGIVRAVLVILISGNRFLPKWIGRLSAGPGSGVMERIVGEVAKLPPEVHPMVRAHWSRARSFRAMAAYLECLPACARAAITMPLRAHIPFISLSAASATQAELSERESWVRQSARARHVVVEQTSHWLQLDRPDLVVAAVRELLAREPPLQ